MSGSRRPGLLQAAILIAAVSSTTMPMVIGPVLPAIQDHFRNLPGVALLVPMLITLPAAVTALLSGVAGMVADRLGRRNLLVAALIGYALVGTAPLYLGSLKAILASRAIVGIFEAAAMAVSTTMIGDYFDARRRDFYIAVQTASASLSGVLIGLAGGWLGTLGWRAPFAVYAVMGLLAPFALLLLWEPRQKAPKPEPVAMAGARPWVSEFLVVLAVMFAAGIILMVMPLQLSYLLVEAGITSSAVAGTAFAWACVGTVAGTFLFGRFLGGRSTPALQFTICAAVCALGCLVTGWAHEIVAGSVIASVGVGISLPAGMGWAMRVAPAARRGTCIGLAVAAQYCGVFLSPVLLVPLALRLGSHAAAVAWCGWILAILVVPGAIVAAKSRAAATSAI